jgi:hypothetical protein
VLWHVKIDTPNDKIEDFVSRVDQLYAEMRWQSVIRRVPILRLLAQRSQIWRNAALLIAICINILILIFYAQGKGMQYASAGSIQLIQCHSF